LQRDKSGNLVCIEFEMAAMFSQNPLMNGPNYSFNQAPATAAGGNKEHGFYP
jgi:20S proteasome subunit beta 6